MSDVASNIERVRRAKAQYCRFVDTKNWAAFAKLFEQNLQVRMFDPAGATIVSFDDRDSFVSICDTSLVGAQTIHQVHNDEIDQISDGEISATWSMEDMIIFGSPGPGQPARMHGFGHYHELWRLGAEGWRIARLELRRTILEFTDASDQGGQAHV